ncbi:MAG: hypothetical protein JWR25_59 [Noviherbaspirillum sp.]|nr:hypothetical protein [Noviherbaspirillum sp.]
MHDPLVRFRAVADPCETAMHLVMEQRRFYSSVGCTLAIPT